MISYILSQDKNVPLAVKFLKVKINFLHVWSKTKRRSLLNFSCNLKRRQFIAAAKEAAKISFFRFLSCVLLLNDHFFVCT